MPLLSVNERARPIMEYVRDLEGKVLRLRREQQRFNFTVFALGYVAGAASTYLLIRLLG